MTYLILAALTMLALAVYVLAENAPTIRAWINRDPLRLDEADARAHGRCGRPNCTVNHEAFWGKR